MSVATADGALTRTRQGEPGDNQHGAEGEEPDVPPQRPAQVVANMMDPQDLVVDQPFDDV